MSWPVLGNLCCLVYFSRIFSKQGRNSLLSVTFIVLSDFQYPKWWEAISAPWEDLSALPQLRSKLFSLSITTVSYITPSMLFCFESIYKISSYSEVISGEKYFAFFCSIWPSYKAIKMKFLVCYLVLFWNT